MSVTCGEVGCSSTDPASATRNLHLEVLGVGDERERERESTYDQYRIGAEKLE